MSILVLYHNATWPLRGTIAAHLRSFERHSGSPCVYFNTRRGPLPKQVVEARFDLVVLHTTLLAVRWDPAGFRRLMDRLRPVAGMHAVKLALPQDEFYNTAQLCRFLEELGVDVVASAAAPTEWPKIYPGLGEAGVRFVQVLTGYVDEHLVRRVTDLGGDGRRPVDLGYRAWHAEPWLGRHGRLKVEIADVFGREADASGLVADISTREEDVLLGDDWFRFLLRCRWSLGVEGGASILDQYGTLRAATNAYLAAYPNASFEEVERVCFPGADGNLALRALGPRHLEACATRTPQVLVEGEYNGVLRAGVHYLPVRGDFADVADVLSRLKDEDLRRTIADRAYDDVVESGRWGYATFVDTVLGAAGLAAPASPAPLGRTSAVRLEAGERVSRLTLAVQWSVLRAVARVLARGGAKVGVGDVLVARRRLARLLRRLAGGARR